MQLPVFEQAFLLKSLGWAIGNSLWQTGILWLIYQLIVNVDRKIAPLVKHALSIFLLFSSFTWFIFTIAQNYLSFINMGNPTVVPMGLTFNMPFDTDALPVLSVIYLVLLCYYLLKFFKNLSSNRQLQQEGLTKAPMDYRLFISRTAIHLGIKKKIMVWMSEHVDVPSVTGFIKPVILLPAAIMSQLSTQQIEAILLHELAHIKRNDYLVNLFQAIVELTLFFNPFVFLLSKAAKKERENCCDDWVRNFQYDHYLYASALLQLEEQRNIVQNNFALAATDNGKHLLQRVQRLFTALPQTYFSDKQKIKLGFLFILLMTGIFSVVPFMVNKTVIDLTVGSPTKKNPDLQAIKKLSKEIISTGLILNQPSKMGDTKIKVMAKSNIKRKQKIEQDGEYLNAYINEELLLPERQLDPVITNVVDKGSTDSKVFVVIEEQQSGKNPTNTYYFELNNNDGNADIKPLIILNRYRASGKKTIQPSLTDSLNPRKKASTKVKITS